MPLPDNLPGTYEGAHQFYNELRSQAKTARAWDEAERFLGRNDLFYLLIRILRRPDLDNPWHFEKCRMVQAEPDNHLDIWFREAGKSSIVTFGMTIMDVILNPNITVAIFSHTKKIAKSFLQVIARELEDNDRLKALYPNVFWANPRKDAPQWSDDGIIVKRTGNPKESTIEAHGLTDSQPVSRHFMLRVYDDTVTVEATSTAEQIEKTTAAWSLSENLGVQEDKGGRVRYIGTRYSLTDTYAEIMKRGAAIPRIFPATHNGRIDGVPVLFSQKEWDKRVRNQSRATVAAQLLCDPMADAAATFQVAWLKSWEIRPRTLNVYILCDPSAGRTAASDNTAMVVIGIAASGTKWLLDGFCHRMTLSQRWTNLKNLYRKWSRMEGVQHIEVGYERYSMQSDIEYFEERMLQEKLVFSIAELNWTRDNAQSKTERVARLEPDFRNGRFFLPVTVIDDHTPSVWTVEDDPAADGYGQMQLRPSEGLSRLQMDSVKNGSSDLIAKPLRQVDAEGHLYDLTLLFVQEYQTFPFGPKKDLIDAASRIYDMHPTGPTLTSQEDAQPKVYWDA